jgi:hypothetical protein
LGTATGARSNVGAQYPPLRDNPMGIDRSSAPWCRGRIQPAANVGWAAMPKGSQVAVTD